MSDTDSPWILDVSAATFERDVLENSTRVPVVVDFWAPWCGPCRTLGPILERLVQERQGRVILARVNTEDQPDLASYFQISAIPAIKIFHQGQLIHEFEGLAPEQALRGLFDQLDPKGSQALTGAHDAEQKSPAQAEKQYRDLLTADPDNAEARVGLARVLLAQGKLDDVPDVLEPLGSGGETGAEADRIKAQL
jgi:putative thioredoxin